MIKVCVIGVYFGNLPNYFDLWLKSAASNSSVDFLIFTDQKKSYLPTNVRFEDFSLEKMKNLASSKLDFEVCLERPYKCCDFKPSYGLIFEDYLQDYDYWGHCDFDLIWGDLRYFFNKYHIENYDKFLNLGHLSLYKNTYKNNRNFMLDGSRNDYKKVYTDTRNFAFDETTGVYQIYKKNNISCFDKRIFADISSIYSRYRLALDDTNYDYQVFCWDSGHVYRYYFDNKIKRDEFIYIHFKERGRLPYDGECLNNDSFYIANRGFYPCLSSNINLDEIQKYNRFESKNKETKELKRFNKKKFRRKLSSKFNRLVGKKEKLR